MAHSGTSRILAAKGGYTIQDFGHRPGSLCGQKRRKKEEVEQKSASPKTIVVEQWLCFVLGCVCMAFGVWGICMKPEQDVLSAHIVWLGSLYMPTLRVTAVVCIGLGVVLARRGWAHL